MENVGKLKEVVNCFESYVHLKFGQSAECDIKKIEATGNENIYIITWMLENSILVKTNAFISKTIVQGVESMTASYVEDVPVNTRVEYLYRDGSNYKRYNSEVVAGIVKKEDQTKIKRSLIEGEWFIPSQIGFSEERFEDVNEDDHDYFELTGFSYTNESPTVNILAWELAKKFQDANFAEPESKEIIVQKFYDFLRQPKEITRVFIRKGTHVYMVEGGVDPWNWHFEINKEDIDNFANLLDSITDIPIYQTSGDGVSGFNSVDEAIVDIAGSDKDLLKDFIDAFARRGAK